MGGRSVLTPEAMKLVVFSRPNGNSSFVTKNALCGGNLCSQNGDPERI